MRVTRSDSERLTVADFPYLIGVITFGVSILLLFKFAERVFTDSYNEKGWPMLGGSALRFAFGCIFTQRNVFDFNRVSRTLTWSRLSILGYDGGVIPFSEILSVNIRCLSSGYQTLNWQLVLKTANGIRPLTQGYSGYFDAYQAIRVEIEKVLELPPSTIDDDIRELRSAGRNFEAKKLEMYRDRIMRPGACLNCGYNLTGNISGICPECGRAIANKS